MLRRRQVKAVTFLTNSGAKGRSMDDRRTFVLACATVIEEMLPFLPPGTEHRVLDFGLHSSPSRLQASLQEAIDELQDRTDVILLGYGLCSQGTIGLRAGRCTIVLPRVDDCISIFLGSRAAHHEESSREPGTYYLTKGWIEAGDGPFADIEGMQRKYGHARATRLMAAMFGNYRRLALINTGNYDLERYRAQARGQAQRVGLRFEEIDGSDRLVRKMIEGPWDEEFVVVGPGGTVEFKDFFRSGAVVLAPGPGE
jgi:hypothetical protein